MTLRLENIFILFLWWFIFMVILPWDQEKIVVLNLVVFVYFLYFMAGVSINNAMEQKKDYIKQILKKDLVSQNSTINDMLKDIKVLEKEYSFFILNMIKLFLSSVSNYFNKNLTNISNTNSLSSLLALPVISSLFNINKAFTEVQLQKSIFISKIVLESAETDSALEDK